VQLPKVVARSEVRGSVRVDLVFERLGDFDQVGVFSHWNAPLNVVFALKAQRSSKGQLHR
jgi:hypothetical protein